MSKNALSKIIVLIILSFLQSCIVEPCDQCGTANQEIELNSQQQVDSFKYTLPPDCTNFIGKLKIFGSIQNLHSLDFLKELGEIEILLTQLKDLEGLHNLTRIERNISVTVQSNLTNLNHLSSLKSVGGDVYLSRLKIIKDISGFKQLTTINGNLIISASDSLQYISGFNKLREIGGQLIIYDNYNLLEISGCNQLDTIDYLLLHGNSSLQNFDGLKMLRTIRSDLIVEGNSKLENLTFLSALNFIGEGISIQNNEMLSNFEGLEKINKLGEALLIKNNPKLLNINHLKNISIIKTAIEIENNPLLSSCCGLYKVLSTNAAGGPITINNNQQGCNSVQEILATGNGNCD